MSLITCDECGRKISSSSLFCPGCGYPTHLNKAYPGSGEPPQAFTALKSAISAPTPETAAPETQPTPPPEEQPEQAPETQPAQISDEEPEAEAIAARRHHKLTIFFITFFTILLAAVLYFYFSTPLETVGDDGLNLQDSTETVVPEKTSVTSPDTVSPDTTTAAAIKTGVSTETPAAKTPVTKKAKPKNTPKKTESTPATEETHEVTVKSLREQVSTPSSSTTTAE